MRCGACHGGFRPVRRVRNRATACLRAIESASWAESACGGLPARAATLPRLGRPPHLRGHCARASGGCGLPSAPQPDPARAAPSADVGAYPAHRVDSARSAGSRCLAVFRGRPQPDPAPSADARGPTPAHRADSRAPQPSCACRGLPRAPGRGGGRGAAEGAGDAPGGNRGGHGTEKPTRSRREPRKPPASTGRRRGARGTPGAGLRAREGAGEIAEEAREPAETSRGAGMRSRRERAMAGAEGVTEAADVDGAPSRRSPPEPPGSLRALPRSLPPPRSP